MFLKNPSWRSRNSQKCRLLFSREAFSRYPGVPTLDILGNVVPYISGEEEKVEREAHKLLGKLTDGQITKGDFVVSAHCNRVLVENGHTEAVSLSLRTEAKLEDLIEAWETFRAVPQERKLPTAPKHPIIVRQERDRPQPKFDTDVEGGMAAVIGRARLCPVLQFKYTTVSHNTIRGAAGAAGQGREKHGDDGRDCRNGRRLARQHPGIAIRSRAGVPQRAHSRSQRIRRIQIRGRGRVRNGLVVRQFGLRGAHQGRDQGDDALHSA